MPTLALAGLVAGGSGSCGTSAPSTGFTESTEILVSAGVFRAGALCDLSQTEPACDRSFLKGRRTPFLEAFVIDRNLVTRDEYELCVKAEACISEPSLRSSRDPLKRARVRYGNAKDYCRWRGAHLPTHAQFERIARGTDGRVEPWGKASSPCRDSEPSLRCLTYEGPTGARSVAFNPQWADDGLIRGASQFTFEALPPAEDAFFRCAR